VVQEDTTSEVPVEDLVSNDVLEFELDLLNKSIISLSQKQQTPPPQLLQRKKALEEKLKTLKQQVESGKLSSSKYFASLKSKIAEERELAKKLLHDGKKTQAAQSLKRAKLMENELRESEG